MLSPYVIVIMGVSGSGKTTVGKLLATALDWQFVDADSFHSAGNIEKMMHGISLDDSDRRPWLESLQQAIRQWLKTKTPTVLACSALKSTYRQLLSHGLPEVKIVYLKGSFELVQQRLQQRQGHFMAEALLQSQFSTLEEPEAALVVEITQSPEVIVRIIRKEFEI